MPSFFPCGAHSRAVFFDEHFSKCFLDITVIGVAHFVVLCLAVLRIISVKVAASDRPHVLSVQAPEKAPGLPFSDWNRGAQAALVLSVLSGLTHVLSLFLVEDIDAVQDYEFVVRALCALALLSVALAAGYSSQLLFVPGTALRCGWVLLFLAQVVKTQTVTRYELDDFGDDKVAADGYTLFDLGFAWTITVFYMGLAILGTFPMAVGASSTGYERIFLSDYSESGFPDMGADTHPELKASFLSWTFFAWFDPIMSLGRKRPLNQDDIWPLIPDDFAAHSTRILETYWTRELTEHPENPSLARALRLAYGPRFYLGGVFKLVQDISMFFAPIVLGALIRYVEEPDKYEEWEGYAWAGGLFLSQVVQSLASHHYFNQVIRCGNRARSGVMSLVFKKALVLSNASKQRSTVGNIVTLQSSDAQRILDVSLNLHLVWSSPLQISLALYLLYETIGPSSFAGIATIFLLLPIQAKVAIKLEALKKSIMKHTDERIREVNEVLQAISVIKLYAWEDSFAENIRAIRDRELVILRKTAVLQALNIFLLFVGPAFIAVVSFAVYSAAGNDLTAEKAYTALTLFSLIQTPLIFFPMMLAQLVQARVGVKRITAFLTLEELRANPALPAPSASTSAPGDGPSATPAVKGSVVAQDATFSWDDSSEGSERKPVLTNVTMKVEPGELHAIIGETGSGKSSLLAGLLGELKVLDGHAALHGTIAYVSQSAWIFNASLRDNILFGLPFHAERYAETLRVCALERDLKVLPAGDRTEIGEKGVNLSGGQKQRVSLARAVYRDADVYVLDDPISAVDAHVGAHIFDECITGRLKNKTRLLVMNQLQFLPRTDSISVLKGSRIAEQGSYSQLMANGCDFAALMQSHGAGDGEEDDEDADGVGGEGGAGAGAGDKDDQDGLKQRKSLKRGASGALKRAKSAKDLIEAEERQVGKVDFAVYKRYAMAAGGLSLIAVILMSNLIATVCQVGGNWWLGIWAEEEISGDYGLEFYLGIYFAINVANALMVLVSSLVFGKATPVASTKLHADMLHAVLRAPMSFFDTTPTGRILNRFSKDTDLADNTLPFTIQIFLRTAFGLFGILLVVVVTTPFVILALVPITGMFLYIQEYYRSTSRELKRIESIGRSPVFNHLSETLNGLATIRAYGAVPQAVRECSERIDRNASVVWAGFCGNRWIGVRLEACASLLVLSATIFAVLSRDDLDPALVGLSISYVLQTSFLMTGTIRMFTETETAMNSIERLLYFADTGPEAAPIVEGSRPPAQWPSAGQISVQGLVMGYRAGTPDVLKGVTLEIAAGSKVGICGRTGAGKSSLLLALFRIVEARAGRIVVDGIDISKIGLKDLRSRLAIIPQMPSLFSGTVRTNLDPFREHSDEQVWTALGQVYLRAVVEELPDQLHEVVTEGGENFSVGQRQLFCLARALLRRSKVLMIDEATASIDMETDRLIQEAIRKFFADCTVISIAHRINTIVDCDKVLVLGDGKVVEYEHPALLLRDASSAFSALVAETGASSAQFLKSKAEEAYGAR